MSDRNDRLPPERLVFFGDAVVAIAITLLVLPLVDLVPEVKAAGEPAETVITGNLATLGSFALSFVVIARLWLVHHRLFDRVEKVGGPLVTVHFLWLATIVVLPLPTEIVGAYEPSQFTEGFYIGTLLVSSSCLSVMGVIVGADRSIAPEPNAPGEGSFVARFGVPVTLLVCLVLVLAFRVLSYEVLLLLFVPGALEAMQGRRASRAAR